MAQHDIADSLRAIVDPSLFTEDNAQKFIKQVINYELRGTNPLAFNTYSLGIHKCFFGDVDRDNFFALYNTSMVEVRRAISKLKCFTQKSSPLRVASDPFNVFISYVIHNFLVSPHIKNKQTRETALIKSMMLLQYKFFTSLVNHYFPHAPNENIMRAMYENMSYKFEIKTLGTWAKVLGERAKSLVDKSSIHLDSLTKYDNDNLIIYFISDTQTRVRSQVNAVTSAFYAAKEENEAIATYSSMTTDKDGEKVITDISSSVDRVILNIYTDCMNINTFIDTKLMSLAISQFKNVNPITFKSFLIAFSEYAVTMYKKGHADKIEKVESYDLLVGPQIFIHTLVRQCYRFCTNNRIDMNRPLLILKAIRDAFSSSRINDEDILQLRKTLEYFVLKLQSNRRDIVMSGLRIGFVLYIILLTFKYTGVFER